MGALTDVDRLAVGIVTSAMRQVRAGVAACRLSVDPSATESELRAALQSAGLMLQAHGWLSEVLAMWQEHHRRTDGQ